MNAKQIAAIKSLTSRLDRNNRMSNGEPLDGTLVFTAEELDPACVMVTARNTPSLGLWDRHIHVIAFVGPRGGIRIKHNDPICY